ncbi:AAA family ATPase [Flavobacterium tegetincola]|uniref:AAA family ATPase n=1 Tax=Flavobacterium tegetincola TaxID=150172 RepID=UPI0004248858|nr:AAA family ATPase [Flavobacterium tegetincola]
MKILAIRIKNLASLEGSTEIDFTSEPLASAGIFAITGPTGAGKSTLLDALCLALYGKTPRYLQAKEGGIDIQDVKGSKMTQGDVRGILRDGTADGYAEVDFVGIDGQFYRATWSVRRAHSKVDGSMQSASITLKNISSNIDLPGKKVETEREIERLVGLNFEQFTRSVLLAQGDFTAFMKASKDEKSSLLEKLTGTHIYSEISKKIFENNRNEDQKLRELHIRSQGVTTFSEEQIAEFKDAALALEVQISSINIEIERLTNEMSWHERLFQLEADKAIALENFAKAEEILKSSQGRKDKLGQIEQAQNTRSWHDALHHSQNQLTEQKTVLDSLQLKISALKEAQLQLTNSAEKEQLNLTQLTEIQKEALPKLAAAKKLDTLIAEKTKQKNTAANEVESAKLKVALHSKEVTQKGDELKQFSAEIQSVQEWQTKFESKKSIAEHKDLIVSKLQDAEKLWQALKNATAEKIILEEKAALSTLELNKRAAAFEQVENEFETREKVYSTKVSQLLIVPIERLQLEKDETDRTLTAAIEAQVVWNDLYTLKKDFEALRQKERTTQVDFKLKNQQFQEIQIAVQTASVIKETSEKLLQKARLSASENVELLRGHLTDDEPCPVCGSENHPYALHNPQLDQVMDTLENLHKKNEKSYLELFGNSNRLQQECKNLSQLIALQKTEIDAKSALIDSKNQAWNALFFAKETETIAEENKALWLFEKIQTLKISQADLQLKIKAISDEKSQLEKDRIQLDVLKEQKISLSDGIKVLKSQMDLFNEKGNGLNQNIVDFDTDLKAVQEGITPHFSASTWIEKWEEQPSEFVTSLNNFAQEWNAKKEQLERNVNQHALASATLLQLQQQSKNLEEDLNLKLKNLDVISHEFDTQKAERVLIFDGQSAELMEIQFATAVEKAQHIVLLIQNNLQQNKIDLATAETSFNETTANTAKVGTEIMRANAAITDWLQTFNLKSQSTLNFLELRELLNFSPEWIEKERKELQSFAEERTKSSSILAERTQKFSEHVAKRPSERQVEVLKLIFEKAKAQSEIWLQEKSAIVFKLKEDEQNKIKLGSLLREINAQALIADNWNKLNDIIGSADGKKFRQIAQEHTLDVLLSYANLHLQDLTNRYKIERIPNTLGLQVVDQDMGDEIRTVYSLSGGESFLVSLALALGLASLSSSKMKVESLFIDEGFGSLDPNTLNIAMDALERLHNLGRKVGVISHVQEMTERIPVQIKVSKKASGRSSVEIVGV